MIRKFILMVIVPLLSLTAMAQGIRDGTGLRIFRLDVQLD